MTDQEAQNLPAFDPNTENGKRCLSAFFAITLGHVLLPDVNQEGLDEDTIDKILAEGLVNGAILSGALMSLGLMEKQDLERALLEALSVDPRNPTDEAIFQVALILRQISGQIPRMDQGLREMQASLAELQSSNSHSS